MAEFIKELNTVIELASSDAKIGQPFIKQMIGRVLGNQTAQRPLVVIEEFLI